MGIKLLLADDSITIQKVVGIIFASDEYELSLVDNGDAALVKAKELIPDVFLVDAIMPGKNGYEVCAEVRSDPALSNVPLLLLTGAFEPFDEDKARQCGADDMITKPFESQQLIDKVEALLQLGRSRAAAPAAAASPAVAEPESAPVADTWDVDAASFGAADSAWGETPAAPDMDLWDDLAAATDLPPAADDAAAAFGIAATEPVAPAASAPVEPAVVVPVAAEEPRPAAVPSPTVEPLEALPEDDLWGAFVLEDEVDEPVQFGDIIEEPADELLADIDEIEPLMLAEEEDFVDTTAPLADESASPADDNIFGDEQPASAVAPIDDSVFGFGPDDDAVAAAVAVELPVEPVAAPAFDATPAAAAADIPVPAAAVVTPAAEPVITEELLAAALSRLSRDVIEKIVWEVVPDLAESLIREELRKIREQA